MYLISLIVALALASDMSTGRIPNWLIGIGLLCSQFYVLCSSRSVYFAFKAILLGAVIVLILFPIFMIGSLGAGDIKLLMLLPNYWTFSECWKIILAAFILAAVIGVGKLIICHCLLERVLNLFHYLRSVLNQRIITSYDQPIGVRSYKTYTNQIHFSLPIFLSVMICVGGII